MVIDLNSESGNLDIQTEVFIRITALSSRVIKGLASTGRKVGIVQA